MGFSLFKTFVHTKIKQRIRKISDFRFNFSNSRLINGAPIKKLGVARNKYFGVLYLRFCGFGYGFKG